MKQKTTILLQFFICCAVFFIFSGTVVFSLLCCSAGNDILESAAAEQISAVSENGIPQNSGIIKSSIKRKSGNSSRRSEDYFLPAPFVSFIAQRAFDRNGYNNRIIPEPENFFNPAIPVRAGPEKRSVSVVQSGKSV